MKQKITGSLIGCALALLAPQIVQAQGTMNVLSNLDQTSAGSLAVGSDSWLASDFFTGTNASGYMLDSIQLGMAGASGSPNEFTVMLYSSFALETGLINPGSSLGTLNGSLNPIAGGTFTYTPASNLTLSPNTAYFIVLTAGTTVVNGAYEWDWIYPSMSYNPNGNWYGGGSEFKAGSGSLGSWGYLGEYYPQYAITATAIPEPGVLGLFGLGSLCFLWHRRKAT